MTKRLTSAFLAPSTFSSLIPAGTLFEKPNKSAIPRNNPPTQAYKMITLDKLNDWIISSEIAEAVPNNASATIKGPMVVPKLLIPPPRLIRLLPVASSPSAIMNGFAEVCCNEKPSATMNSPSSIPAKTLAYTETIIAPAPSAENSNP